MARREYERNVTYIEGNVVRKPQAEPKRRPAVPQKSREEIRREREHRMHARRNLERASAFNRGYMAFVTAALAVCALVCCAFIYLQSDITTRMASITALETEISDLTADNEAAESRLETTMTLSEISERAAELGLVYPSGDQIRYYSVKNDDYMNTY
ncbi:MAG: hypothetical protein LUD71_07130 [Clostridiales bacterium]|nr:hypothetical protein [Clostridiales bacterium]